MIKQNVLLFPVFISAGTPSSMLKLHYPCFVASEKQAELTYTLSILFHCSAIPSISFNWANFTFEPILPSWNSILIWLAFITPNITDVCTMCVCWVCIHSVIACWPAFHSKARASSHRWRWLLQLTTVTHWSYPQIFLPNAKVSNCRWRFLKVPKCTLAWHRLDLHHPWWHQSIQLTACKHQQNVRKKWKNAVLSLQKNVLVVLLLECWHIKIRFETCNAFSMYKRKKIF